MAFGPDIIVTDPDAFEMLLVVEVLTSARELEESERQLKSYMADVRSPIGLLVTPERLRIYRDRYLAPGEDSVSQVGEFDVKAMFGVHAGRTSPSDEFAFEREVQAWLESLSMESALSQLQPKFRSAIQRYILPALLEGIVSSAHPRVLTND